MGTIRFVTFRNLKYGTSLLLFPEWNIFLDLIPCLVEGYSFRGFHLAMIDLTRTWPRTPIRGLYQLPNKEEILEGKEKEDVQSRRRWYKRQWFLCNRRSMGTQRSYFSKSRELPTDESFALRRGCRIVIKEGKSRILRRVENVLEQTMWRRGK